jgi:hypothetical protein
VIGRTAGCDSRECTQQCQQSGGTANRMGRMHDDILALRLFLYIIPYRADKIKIILYQKEQKEQKKQESPDGLSCDLQSVDFVYVFN